MMIPGFIAALGAASPWSPAARFAAGARGAWWNCNITGVWTDLSRTMTAGLLDNVRVLGDGLGVHHLEFPEPGPVLRQYPGGKRYLDHAGGFLSARINAAGTPDLNFPEIEVWIAGRAANTENEIIINVLHSDPPVNPWTRLRLNVLGETDESQHRMNGIGPIAHGLSGDDLGAGFVMNFTAGSSLTNSRVYVNETSVFFGGGGADITYPNGRSLIEIPRGDFTGHFTGGAIYDTPTNSPSIERPEDWAYWKAAVEIA